MKVFVTAGAGGVMDILGEIQPPRCLSRLEPCKWWNWSHTDADDGAEDPSCLTKVEEGTSDWSNLVSWCVVN